MRGTSRSCTARRHSQMFRPPLLLSRLKQTELALFSVFSPAARSRTCSSATYTPGKWLSCRMPSRKERLRPKASRRQRGLMAEVARNTPATGKRRASTYVYSNFFSNFWLFFGKLWEARSRLCRSRILQVNTRWKALEEIYKMYILLHRSDIKKSAKKSS